jgi:hypothetical protein
MPVAASLLAFGRWYVPLLPSLLVIITVALSVLIEAGWSGLTNLNVFRRTLGVGLVFAPTIVIIGIAIPFYDSMPIMKRRSLTGDILLGLATLAYAMNYTLLVAVLSTEQS